MESSILVPDCCPQCNHTRLYKDGLRYNKKGEQVQRWLCRKCNYRFTLQPEKSDILPTRYEHIKALNSTTKVVNDSMTQKWREPYSLTEEYHLTNSNNPNNYAQREGTQTPYVLTQKPHISNDKQGQIVSYLWYLKQKGCTQSTIESYGHCLNSLAKHTNLSPEQIKTYLSETTQWSNNTKELVVTICKSFFKFLEIDWEPPKYKANDKIPYIPPNADIDSLISGSGRILSTFLQILKETGARCGEAIQIEWKDVDLERKLIHINHPEKGSNSRTLPISDKLIGMINRLPRKTKTLFGATLDTMKANFYQTRKGLIQKLQNPRLAQIHLHTFRHWKATTTYHSLKDIMHVNYILGHKSIECTRRYINIAASIYQNTTEGFTIKVATTLKEACDLLEAGFEYVTDMEGTKLFRKRN